MATVDVYMVMSCDEATNTPDGGMHGGFMSREDAQVYADYWNKHSEIRKEKRMWCVYRVPTYTDDAWKKYLM